MRFNVLLEPVDEAEEMPGFYYAHVPSLGLTTHGQGIEKALSSARDLVHLWLAEKRKNGESVTSSHESLLATVEVD